MAIKGTIMVTGASGMIGSTLVKGLIENGYRVIGLDRANSRIEHPMYTHYCVDLGDPARLQEIFAVESIDRVIHLAALAHTEGEDDLSWKKYEHVNVTCAGNVFRAAGNRPVLFISTVDVYGFTKGCVDVNTELYPVSHYGKSKKYAEEACRSICMQYSIFRFSPVYTDKSKRDIQKRYYLKAPSLA